MVGNTEIGVDAHFKNVFPPVLICPSHIPDLSTIAVTENGIHIGAAVTLTDVANKLESLVNSLEKYKTRVFTAMLAQLEKFAGNQVRNAACIAGNLVTASPTSDLNPVLLATGAVVFLKSVDGERSVPLTEWFVSYRRVAIKPGEVIVSIFVPFSKQHEYVRAYKQSRRRHDDICIVSSCFRVVLEQQEIQAPVTPTSAEPKKWESTTYSSAHLLSEGFTAQPPAPDNVTAKQWIVKDSSLAFGAMDACTRLAASTSKFLMGKAWNFQLLPGVIEALLHDFVLPQNVPGGMPEYRRTLAASLFFKFFVDTYIQIFGKESVPAKLLSAAHENLQKQLFTSVTDFATRQTSPNDYIGVPVDHISAERHCTGASIYTADLDAPLHAVFIQSTKAHAKILDINASKALALPGVVRVFTYKDVPGSNKIGAPAYDEEVFASSEALCVGYPLGLLVATSHELARQAVKLVEVKYEELPAILTIEDAIKANSEIGQPLQLQTGNIEEGFAHAEQILTGDVIVGGQEHFYLEPNAVVVLPSPEGEYEIICSTQNPTKTQSTVARALGLQDSAVNVTCKRVGGGFGGKETRNIFITTACAVGAYHLKQPLKMVLDRDTDMSITGTRHPFLGKYKIGFLKTGKITAVDIALYSNSGYSADLSIPVMARALFHCDNAYKIENMRCTGHCMKTHKPSNTAFRGFGAPQGMLVIETAISRVAHTLSLPVNVVRELNFYTEGQKTHYGMAATNCYLQKVWAEMLEKSNFKARQAEVAAFNAQHRYTKRGISCLPLKFGLAFTQSSYNQAGALVHIYTDGSVLVSHGGCEIGQGLHTKMAQIAASALNIPINLVRIGDTSTCKVPNTSPTAASTQSDINGMAVLNACKILAERLEEFKKTLGDQAKGLEWKQLVTRAYSARQDLCAHGYYQTPGVYFDFSVGVGQPFAYFVYGAACSEVEIDTLTGDHHIIRSDVVMDVGQSLNPNIDIGQIEGAFVQGYGWSTLEELVTFPNGAMYTLGPSTYKIPGVIDIPEDFRVYLLRDAKNPLAVHSSKGLGEPPLFLGASVFFALTNAVASAREEEHISGFTQLTHPATCEQIRLACRDAFTDPTPNLGMRKPSWTVDNYPAPPDDLRRLS